jgi:hypothetical protein
MVTTTMRGKKLDMARLVAHNLEKIAVSGLPRGGRDRRGNTLHPGMNARGDVLGKGGSIAIPREKVAREYHRTNPKAVKQVSLKDIKQEVFASDTPAQAVQKHKEAMAAAAHAQAQAAQRKQRKIVDND